MLRALVRRLLPPDPHSPSLLRTMFSSRYRAFHRIQRAAWDATGGKVVAGPFAGTRYASRAVGSSLAPKLLGTYEMELWPIINQIIVTTYPVIIDIGAAEGYYAVGLAQQLPRTRIIAFEAQVDQHPTLLNMAELNGVRQRIEMHGAGTIQTLGAVLPRDQRTLIISDIEGYEADLLDPAALPALQHADLLVELHDYYRPGVSELLRKRFQPTHQIGEITSRERTLQDWPPGTRGIDDAMKLPAMNEGRPGTMAWFWMQSNSPVR